MRFEDLGLEPAILKAVAKQGYESPSPIQAQAIPAILKYQDVMAAAQTGTGKTAGFTLPILSLLAKGRPAKRGHIRALVVTPTRELAAQVQESVATYGKHLTVSSAVVFGGVSIQPQLAVLKKGVDILVATPGRLLDLHQQNAISFDHLEILVLDEADRMLDMGFIRDIKKILALLPAKRQNLLFSATFSDDIRALAKGLVNNAVEISVTPRNSTAEAIDQVIYPVDKNKKSAALIALITEQNWQQVLVFSRTKHGANRLAKSLSAANISAVAIHGNKSQTARTNALADFKQGKARVMVATDIAARGIDIDQLPHVVNFDLPNVPEDYVHRIGRTGRAGASGQAASLVSIEEVKLLRDIEKLIKRQLPRQELPEFIPSFRIGDTDLKANQVVKKASKPVRAKVSQPSSSKAKSQQVKVQKPTSKRLNTDAPAKVNTGKVKNNPSTKKAAADKVHSEKPKNQAKQRPKTPSSSVDPYAKAKQKFKTK